LTIDFESKVYSNFKLLSCKDFHLGSKLKSGMSFIIKIKIIMIEETTSSCLVLDSGSLLTRVGFSGEEAPREIVFTDP
jgi:hypothetical protein